jgi:hypothetical protein
MPTKPTRRVALYARESTHHGQDVGLQLDALRDVAAARGWVVVQEFVDEGISGSKQRRPALDALMAAARAGDIGMVLVWRFDRFAPQRPPPPATRCAPSRRRRPASARSLPDETGPPSCSATAACPP